MSNSSAEQQKRGQRLQILEDHIGQHLEASQEELRQAPSWGKPLTADAGYEQTPDEWKLPFKMLKDAGVLPPEVEAMQDIAALKQRLSECTDAEARSTLRQTLQDKQQALALRLERLRGKP
jgi:hypothetical protein